jgi:putative oxidoreductase
VWFLWPGYCKSSGRRIDGVMLKRFLATDSSRTLLFQRALLGTVILGHGLQKVFGWFGGYGFAGTMTFLTKTIGAPTPLAILVIVSDSLGALALITGIGTRLAAIGTILTMLGAILLWHLPNGFFMNWGGTQAGEGFEFHLLALALAVPLAIRGGGAWSVDRALSHALARSN